MKKSKPAAISLALCMTLAMTGCMAEVGTELPPKITKETKTADVAAIRAQDDFYGYMNAKDLMAMDIESGKGKGGSSYEVSIKIKDQLDGIVREIANGDRESYLPGSNEQLIYDCYHQAKAASTGGRMMNDKDKAEVKSLVNSVYKTKTIDEYLTLCGELSSKWNAAPVYKTSIGSDIHNSAAASVVVYPYQTPTGSRYKELVRGGRYANTSASAIRTSLATFGIDSDDVKERSKKDVNFLIDIGYSTDLDMCELLDNGDSDSVMASMKYYTLADIDKMCPNIGSKGLLKIIGVGDSPVKGLYVIDPKQMTKVDSLLTDENLPIWQDLTVVVINNAVKQYLPDDMGGREILYSNDSYALRAVQTSLPKLLGEVFVAQKCSEDDAKAITDMTVAIRDEYVKIIGECNWLSDEGKELITTKLNAVKFFIGSDKPHEIDPEDEKLIGASVFETSMNLQRKRFAEVLGNLTQGSSMNGFEAMAPQTVNACYIPDINGINITYGIMNEPYYNPKGDYYANLGGIGMVIGHEISHAFDNSGMNYDAEGNFRPDWMTEKDRKAFEEVSKKISAYYSRYTVLDVHHVKGDKTLPENLADISGLECVLRFAKTSEEKKAVFENYARVWAQIVPRQNAIELLNIDVHSPSKVRVNAVVSLFDEFYEIYGVKESDKMYVAPEDRVKRW